MCHITTIVSGAVSLGVLAGVLSGIVYVVLVGLKWVGKLRLSLEEEALKGRRDDNFLAESLCIKCRSRNGTLSNGSAGSEQCCETCTCNGSVCSGSGNHVHKRGSRRISENWSVEKGVDTPDSEDSNDSKTVLIREELEKLVEEMVGGSLDGVSVGKLSTHSGYLAMFAKHHEPLCQELAKLGYALHIALLNKNGFEVDSPRAAHSALKSLVEKIVAEAMKLPNIKEMLHSQNATEESGNDNNFSNKSYEDILATAILNKVIEQCQSRQGRTNNKIHKRSVVKNMRNRNNNIINVEDEGESNDLFYNSDWSDTSRSEQLSLTIEEHIEEITTTYENSEEEELDEERNFNCAIPFPESGRVILDGDRGDSDGEGDTHSSATELITAGNSWEENWLFQRKRLRSGAKSHHPVPVPMLVPNPSQDFRALIGGVDADDLSDMSECSDSVLEDIVLAADDEKPHSSEEQANDDSITNENDEVNEIPEMAEVEGNAAGSPISLNSESSCPSLSQKERDVSVDYECFRKFDIELQDPPLSRPRSLDLESVEKEEEKQPLKCRIAEREKEKWNHPIPLANNPYSAENILKREQRKKLDYFRSGYCSEEFVEIPGDSAGGIVEEPKGEIYSRNYYIRASRCPTGDPSIQSTPETEEPELTEEVWKHMSEAKESFPKDEEKSAGNGSVTQLEASNSTKRKSAVDCWEEGVLRNRIAEATNIILPNVKELTKKFSRGIEEFSPRASPTPSVSAHGIPDFRKERSSSARNLTGVNVAECESSSSYAVTNGKLSPTNSASSRSNVSTGADQEVQTNEPAFSGTVEICETPKTGDKIEDAETEGRKQKSTAESKEAIKVSSSLTFAKSTGKEVHSLTARSISKEFREELKNNSSRRSIPKVDRGSCGESDRVEVVSESVRNRSPTPPIDLQSKRKFWEDIISNAQK